MHQSFFATIRVRDVIEELDVVDLVRVVSGDNTMAENYSPAIRAHKLELVTKFLDQIVLY